MGRLGERRQVGMLVERWRVGMLAERRRGAATAAKAERMGDGMEGVG
jgi:hypothetical protein